MSRHPSTAHAARVFAATLGVALSAHALASESTIKLPTGEVMKVQVLETTETQMRVRHPWLGELLLPREGVKVLGADEVAAIDAAQKAAATADAKASGAPAAPAPAAPASPADGPKPEEKEWKFKLFAGGSYTTGNTKTANVSSKFTAVRENKETITTLDAAYFYGEDRGVSTQNRFSAGGRNDWLLPESRWFFFVQGRYDYDQFQSWNHRLAGHGGVGYRLILPPPVKFNLIAGAGAVKEFGSQNEDVRPEGVAGFEGEWQIKDKHKLVWDAKWYPDFKNFGRYRNINSAGYSLLLDKELNMSFTAGVQHEYQSNVDPGRQKNDFRVFGGVEFAF